MTSQNKIDVMDEYLLFYEFLISAFLFQKKKALSQEILANSLPKSSARNCIGLHAFT